MSRLFSRHMKTLLLSLVLLIEKNRKEQRVKLQRIILSFY
jgi:hypothetical protein